MALLLLKSMRALMLMWQLVNVAASGAPSKVTLPLGNVVTAAPASGNGNELVVGSQTLSAGGHRSDSQWVYGLHRDKWCTCCVRSTSRLDCFARVFSRSDTSTDHARYQNIDSP